MLVEVRDEWSLNPGKFSQDFGRGCEDTSVQPCHADSSSPTPVPMARKSALVLEIKFIPIFLYFYLYFYKIFYIFLYFYKK